MFRDPGTAARVVLNNHSLIEVWDDLKNSQLEDTSRVVAALVEQDLIKDESGLAQWVNDMDELYGQTHNCLQTKPHNGTIFETRQGVIARERESSILKLFILMFALVYGILVPLGLLFV